MKILIVEDEDSIREVEKAYLQRAGYKVYEARDGDEAISMFQQNKFDLILLDLNLPKKDGVEICKEIRKTSQVPIIMVTARVEEMDELIGLEIGADDYMKKPFSPSILVARVNSVLRRLGTEIIKIDDMEIDPERVRVIKGEEKIELTATQFNILYMLARHPGKVFNREEILDRAYQDSIPRDILDRTVDAHVKGLRKAIETDPKDPKYILTVIGKGYKFNDEL